MVLAETKLLPNVVSGSQALLQAQYLSMSVTHVTTECYADVCDMRRNLGHVGAQGSC